MKPAPFEFFAPNSTEEVLALLERNGDEARVLAGGQSLVPMLNLRMVQPAVLVSINGCSDLDYIRDSGDEIRIGARTRQIDAERSPLVIARVPLLARVMPWVGGMSNRNRGTVCGSMAHADPLAELPAVALTLDAKLVVSSKRGSRIVDADGFFVGPLTTAIRSGEMLSEIRFPCARVGERFGFEEVSNRAHGFAVAAVAARVAIGDGGVCRVVRIAAIGGGASTVRLRLAETSLVGRTLDERTIADAVACARAEIDPPADIHADAAYRRQVIGTLVARVLSTINESGR